MENQITSVDNEKIKHLRKLNQAKYRQAFGQFFVENTVMIKDALESGIIFDQLFVTQEYIDKNQDLFGGLIKKTEDEDYYLIDEKINNSFSNLDTAPGICAVYKIVTREFIMADKIIYLNNISDPGNLGSIFRSALAFGFHDIVLDKHCVDIYNYKVGQSAKDAIFKLNIHVDSDGNILSAINNSMEIYSTSLNGEENILAEIKEKDKYCLVFGNESHGVDRKILAVSDKQIKLRINKEIESLNVASSAAIIFHELFKD